MNAPNWIATLPVASSPADRWQISLRTLSLMIEEPKEAAWQPYLLLIVESGSGAVLGHRLLDADLDPDLVIDLLMATMGEPAVGAPRRPAKIQTDKDDLMPPLKEISTQTGIPIERTPDLPELSYAIQTFEEFISQKPSLFLDDEDANPDAVADFFQAAAFFHRAKCWKRILDTEPITFSIISEKSADVHYAVVMGNGGIARGLALYDDAEDLEDLYYAQDSVDPSELACTSTVFCEKNELSDEQLKEIKENGWEVASYKAYPIAIRTDVTGPPRMPTMEQLRVLEVALYMIPDFVETLHSRKNLRMPFPPQPWLLKIGEEEIRMLIGYGIYNLDEEQMARLSEMHEMADADDESTAG